MVLRAKSVGGIPDRQLVDFVQKRAEYLALLFSTRAAAIVRHRGQALLDDLFEDFAVGSSRRFCERFDLSLVFWVKSRVHDASFFLESLAVYRITWQAPVGTSFAP